MKLRKIMQGLSGAALALAFAATPVAAAPLVPAVATAQCVLEPGVYGIIDSGGRLLGILIVYPDCRLEVFRRVEPE
ncbi:MAG TPA: hypothetical protein VFT45_04480 [Longimicrobium sp.]|nr:hypothetical protein [Longimicrobium sp.]